MTPPTDQITKIKNIVRKDIPIIDIINRINVHDDIIYKNITPPKLIETCGGFSCICWKKGIKDFCTDQRFKNCLKCYNNSCIRVIEGHEKQCNKI